VTDVLPPIKVTYMHLDTFLVSQYAAIACFLFYTGSITFGILITSRSFSAPTKPFLKFHKIISYLGFVTLLVHVATVVLTHINGAQWTTLFLIQATVPQVLGVSAFWLAVLIPLTFSLKSKGVVSQEFWRHFHYFGYAVWTLALGHALIVGQHNSPPALALYIACAIIVCKATWWRTHRGIRSSWIKENGAGKHIDVQVVEENGNYRAVVRLLDENDNVVAEETRTSLRSARRLEKKWIRLSGKPATRFTKSIGGNNTLGD
jgi:hypothetical protein